MASVSFRMDSATLAELDELVQDLGLTRSDVLRDLVQEAIPTLGPVLRMVQEAKARQETDASYFLDTYKALLMRRVRQLERAVEELEVPE